MLVVKRKAGEEIDIGSDVVISILEVRANHVKIGIEAPKTTRVLRAELRAGGPET